MRSLSWIAAVFVAVGALAGVGWFLSSSSERASVGAHTAEVAPIAGDPMAALDSRQRASLLRWLAANPLYALIIHDYCECAEVQGNHPYVAVGDFNSDGHSDFAVLVGFKDGTAGPAALFVFNGPFGGDLPTVAFTATGWARNDALYADGGLFIGPSESDNGYSLVPKGQTYGLRYAGDVG